MYMTRRTRALRLDAINLAVEKGFKREIFRLKNAFINDQLDFFKRNGHLSDMLVTDHAVEMAKVFTKYHGRAIKLTSIEVEKQLNIPKFTENFHTKKSRWDFYLVKWATLYGGRMARETALTTYSDLNELIKGAFENGEDEKEVIKAGLRAKQFSAYRADAIARTETHNAATFAAFSTANDISSEIGVRMVKIWYPATDDRTRDSHAAMISHPPIGMSEKFSVGGVEMDRPGDPSGPPEEVINCRCALLTEVDETSIF